MSARKSRVTVASIIIVPAYLVRGRNCRFDPAQALWEFDRFAKNFSAANGKQTEVARTRGCGLSCRRMRQSSFSRLGFRLLVFLVLVNVAARAQSTVVWTTNFYAVTGANFREIREAIAKARPWRDSFDGDTRWDIRWTFTTAPSTSGCSCSNFRTSTKITTTLPRWTPPPDVLAPVKEQWTRYFTNLAEHEAGHARLGLAAAAEVQRQIARVGTQPDCAQVKQIVNERASQVVADFRRREREYDERTDHGRR